MSPTCLTVRCLSSHRPRPSLSSVSAFCSVSSPPLTWSSSSMWSESPSTKSHAHPQNEEYCSVAIHNPLTQTIVIPQLRVEKSRCPSCGREGQSFPCRGAEFDPHGFSVQQTIEIHLLHFCFHSFWTFLSAVHQPDDVHTSTFPQTDNHSWSCRTSILEGVIFHKMSYWKFL